MRIAEGDQLTESKASRLKTLLSLLHQGIPILDQTLPFLKAKFAGGDLESLERIITERFASQLPALTVLVEAEDQDLQTATEGMASEERQEIFRLRNEFMPFKTQIQSANLFEQGYLHRITGVRHRPYLFFYSGTPAMDFTLRSFDRNVLRVIDTLDNTVGLIAGLTEAVANAYEKSVVLGIQIPKETNQKLFEQLTRVGTALQKLQPILGMKPDRVAQLETSKRSGRRAQRSSKASRSSQG